ncbi:uncharacterized protein DNG_09335 [Cephalotrichum gorgonifer]|uniref:Uncharacterized protein n=1 Tax=Cephalotrichum gorgonifer TaxID=2041049 RepID=A0AAE8SZB1_9PEZI|nr:uncharacterized protein DNG_09335 [Cephalotrichum gorgonifer]
MSLAEGATIMSGQSLPHHPQTVAAAPERIVDSAKEATSNNSAGPSKADEKSKKRSLFGLGKKKKSADIPDDPPSLTKSIPSTYPPLSRDASKLSSTTRSTSPLSHSDFIMAYPTSPTRGVPGSPRVSSPAGSQIFERDVQEYATMPTSPAIPSHIQTENHIPPVLNASSDAIADDRLDPDSVEILTHSSHLPASAAVTGAGPTLTYEQMSSSWAEELAAYADRDRDDAASNFTPLDSSNVDIRRLSFISFADMVQAEHGSQQPGGLRDSVHLAGAGLTSLSNLRRSPSPIRSPVSSQGPGTSPPTSKSGSVRGDLSPSRKPFGSPKSTQYGIGGGDINVETMSQALKSPGSADLGPAARSTPVSPI